MTDYVLRQRYDEVTDTLGKRLFQLRECHKQNADLLCMLDEVIDFIVGELGEPEDDPIIVRARYLMEKVRSQ